MHYIGTLLGLIGVFKYVVDRVVIDIFQQFKEVIGESLKSRGNLSAADQQLIALDMVGRFWTKISNSSTHKVTLFTKTGTFFSSAYE